MTELLETTLAGRYELECLLGRGGMSAVYKARDLALDRLVAVKVMSDELVEQPSMRARFEREARAAAQIAHPNVAHIYDFGSEDGVSFIAMEYVPGRSLRRLLETDGPLSPRTAIEIARQTGEALAAAHRLGILHRDVKPENILVLDGEASVRVKVVDFGLAKLLDDTTGTQLTGTEILGTPRYMAPERFTGGEVDARTDVYALGVVLYEMLAGRAPFDGSVTEIIGKHVYAARPRLQPVHDGPLAELVERAMAREPGRRPATIDEFLAELRSASPTARGGRVTQPMAAPSTPAGDDDPTVVGAPTNYSDDEHSTRVRPPRIPTVFIPRRFAVPLPKGSHGWREQLSGARLRALVAGAAGALALLVGAIVFALLGAGDEKAREVSGPAYNSGAPRAALPRGTVRVPDNGKQRLILGVDPQAVQPGALLEITDLAQRRTEVFELRPTPGGAWRIGDDATSNPSGLTLDEVLRQGATCSLVVRNLDGSTSVPTVSVEPSPPPDRQPAAR